MKVERITVYWQEGLKEKFVSVDYCYDTQTRRLYGKKYPLPIAEYERMKADTLKRSAEKGNQVVIKAIEN